MRQKNDGVPRVNIRNLAQGHTKPDSEEPLAKRSDAPPKKFE